MHLGFFMLIVVQCMLLSEAPATTTPTVVAQGRRMCYWCMIFVSVVG